MSNIRHYLPKADAARLVSVLMQVRLPPARERLLAERLLAATMKRDAEKLAEIERRSDKAQARK